MSDTYADDDSTINIETEYSTETELETLEPVGGEEYETPQEAKARAFKEQRREENRLAREALKEVPELKAKLSRLEFLKSNPVAEDYIEDIEKMVKENPAISREKAFKYVLAEVNPAKLAELAGETVSRPDRTSLSNWEPSFSEHLGNKPNMSGADLLKAAEKEYARINN